MRLPLVFDLETGETHEGTTAFELSLKQGREVLRSHEGNTQVHSHYRQYNEALKVKRKTMAPDEGVEAPVEEAETTDSE